MRATTIISRAPGKTKDGKAKKEEQVVISEEQMKKIGERIRHIRETKDEKGESLTQAQFAERIGAERETIGKWERGVSPISLPYLLKICDEYGTDPDYILGRIAEKTHDIKDIAGLTGLSSVAVEVLINNVQDKKNKLAEYRNNNEPVNDWYYENGITGAQIREYLINALLTDDELWDALMRNACSAVYEMDRYLCQESGNLLLPPGADNAAGYIIPDFQHIDNVNARRYAVGTAFSAFWDRLCTSAPFVEQGYVIEDNFPEEEHKYNNIIAYGLKKRILHE